MSFVLEKETNMNIKQFFAIFTLGLLLAVPATGLGQGGVKIQSPAEGATLDALDENWLIYEVDPGPRGDHIHVYMDNREAGILRKLKGSYLLETPPAGKHRLCVKVVNKAHVPIGIEQCVNFMVN